MRLFNIFWFRKNAEPIWPKTTKNLADPKNEKPASEIPVLMLTGDDVACRGNSLHYGQIFGSFGSGFSSSSISECGYLNL